MLQISKTLIGASKIEKIISKTTILIHGYLFFVV